MTQELAGKTAVVTGASSGIGRAIGETLGAAGAHVVLAGRTEDALLASKDRIEAAGGKADIALCNVRRVHDVQGLVQLALDTTRRLDIMVNNAGISYPSPIADADPENWREMLETNILALLVGCQAAVKAMRSCGTEGRIVNISSIAAQQNETGVYGATKHAVNTICRSLRKELEGDTIRVVNIMPGAVGTNFARNFDPAVVRSFIEAAGVEAEVKKGERLPEAVFEKLGGMKELLLDPRAVADAVLFAVTQPIHVDISEVVVRPPKALQL